MIGDKLRELRKEKQLTQSEISKLLNIDQSTYSFWERNKYEPSIKQLIELADIFKVSVDYLVGRYKN